MTLQVLTISHPKHGAMNWYFECDVDDVGSENTEFAKAKALAIDLGIYHGDRPDDMITDFFEFENAMREDGLIPQEDELTEALVHMVACNDVWTDADNKLREANMAQNEAYKRATAAAQKVGPLLQGKAKVFEGRVYTARQVSGGVWQVEYREQA